MTATADPVRDQVEVTLRRLAGAITSGPCGVVRAVQGVVAQSAAFVRTIVNLTVDGFLGWDVDAGVPPLGTTAAATAPSSGVAAPSSSAGPRERTRDGGPAGDLAIAGYEDLAASHIVARLDGLERGELEAIRRFELANRGRRTVVGKIDQLLALP